jgi:uncharacterized protein
VGKLTRLLRLLGFDAVFFNGENDSQMVNMAYAEKRILLTRDTHIPERRIVASGRVKAVLIKDDVPENQLRQVITQLSLINQMLPFTLCLECNQPLVSSTREEVKDLVPPYVWQTQQEYMACSRCRRIYWKGTHWQAMVKRLDQLRELKGEHDECRKSD